MLKRGEYGLLVISMDGKREEVRMRGKGRALALADIAYEQGAKSVCVFDSRGTARLFMRREEDGSTYMEIRRRMRAVDTVKKPKPENPMCRPGYRQAVRPS
jgi:hypothetical protein